MKSEDTKVRKQKIQQRDIGNLYFLGLTFIPKRLKIRIVCLQM